jgi:hypothetical protein
MNSPTSVWGGQEERHMPLVYFGTDANNNEYVIDEARVIAASFISEPPTITIVLDAGNGVQERVVIQESRIHMVWTAWRTRLDALKRPDRDGS